jgi:hypothetical protein
MRIESGGSQTCQMGTVLHRPNDCQWARSNYLDCSRSECVASCQIQIGGLCRSNEPTRFEQESGDGQRQQYGGRTYAHDVSSMHEPSGAIGGANKDDRQESCPRPNVVAMALDDSTTDVHIAILRERESLMWANTFHARPSSYGPR